MVGFQGLQFKVSVVQGLSLRACGRVGGVRHESVLRRKSHLAEHSHVQRTVCKAGSGKGVNGAFVPLGGPNSPDGCPHTLPTPLDVRPWESCMKERG